MKTICLLLAFIWINNLKSQCYDYKKDPVQFEKGDMIFNVGIGLLSTFKGKDLSNPIPPLSLTLNYRIKRTITLGLNLGYSLTEANLMKEGSDGKLSDVKKVSNNFYLIGFRFEGHYVRERADFYGGAMMAYNFSNIKSNLERYQDYTNIRIENYADAITWSGHIGFKYLCSKRIGIFCEIGYGVSLFMFGTILKI